MNHTTSLCQPCEEGAEEPHGASRLCKTPLPGCRSRCSHYDCGHGHLDSSGPGIRRALLLPAAKASIFFSFMAAVAAQSVGAIDTHHLQHAQRNQILYTSAAAIGALAAGLFAVLVGRAVLVVGSAYDGRGEVDDLAQRDDDVRAVERCLQNKLQYAQRLGAAIRCKTISRDCGDLEAAGPIAAKAFTQQRDAELRKLHELIQESFPLIHSRLERIVVNQWSLIYIWRARDSRGVSGDLAKSLPYMVYAHLDVVPAPEPETWAVDPWSGEIRDGCIWGRGAIDDKHAVFGHLEAIEDLIEGGFVPKRDVYLCLGHDEEIGGSAGALEIARALASQGVSFEFMLDEGLMIVDGVVPAHPRPVAMVCVGEKGYVTARLTVNAEPGHASLPPKQSAIGTLSRAVSRLESSPFPTHIGMAREMFGALAGGYNGPMALLMANLWLFAPVLARILAAKPKTAAVVRTTTALTIFRSGDKENALPATATAIVNHRIHPNDSVASVIARDRKIINDPNVKIEVLGAVEPARVSSTSHQAFSSLRACVKAIFPGAAVAPALFIAASDSKHFWDLAPQIYRFNPVCLQPTAPHFRL